MAYLVEPLPTSPLEAAVVLHVRSCCRGVINGARNGPHQAELCSSLELIFGLAPDLAKAINVASLAHREDPMSAVADAIGRLTGSNAVELGHDAIFVGRCVDWLRSRIAQEPSYEHMFAGDAQTLLVLSEAMDLAMIPGSRGRPPSTLICGETGTGKELLARAMHAISVRVGLRTADAFVPVHVAGLTPDFVNDELFGHRRGGFTGATSDRKGRIEQAHCGTLLIDEVGDLSKEAQLRLLRVLEDGKVSRTGDETWRDVDVRILAATNRDLDQAVRDGTFRLDLLHRLRRGSLMLPPLRFRSEWQWGIVDQMLLQHGQPPRANIVRSARDAIACHDWPGNLRELDGVLEIAASRARSGPVRLDHLPRHLQTLYLAAPLATRAVGTLCDDLDHAEPDAELVAARITRLRDQISEATVDRPDETQRIQELLQLHESIPDRSEDHVKTLAQLRAVAETMLKKVDLNARTSVWRKVNESVLPKAIENRVTAEIVKLEGEDAKLSGEIEALAHEIDLGNDPWWKFIRELNGLPIFDEATKPRVQAFVVLAAKMLWSLSPAFADKIFLAIRAGGVAALRVALTEAMSQDNERPPGADASPAPEQLDGTGWRALHARFPKKRDVARHLNCDTKTVSKYAALQLGTDPWAKRPESEPEVQAT
jgi:DNA-binding NtrC family response regulator